MQTLDWFDWHNDIRWTRNFTSKTSFLHIDFTSLSVRIKISANGYNFPLYINSNALLSKDNFDDKVFLFLSETRNVDIATSVLLYASGIDINIDSLALSGFKSVSLVPNVCFLNARCFDMFWLRFYRRTKPNLVSPQIGKNYSTINKYMKKQANDLNADFTADTRGIPRQCEALSLHTWTGVLLFCLNTTATITKATRLIKN